MDLDLDDQSYPSKLQLASTQAIALGVTLEVAIFLSQNAEHELQHLVHDILTTVKPPVGRWLVFHKHELSTHAAWVTLARKYLYNYDETAIIGGGSNAYYAQLNRERPASDALDVITYPVTPQVHAYDNRTLVENLPTQRVTLESAHVFSGNQPLAISPITLKPRHNPDAMVSVAESTFEQMPSSVDVRQMSLLGAGWTLGSLKSVMQGVARA